MIVSNLNMRINAKKTTKTRVYSQEKNAEVQKEISERQLLHSNLHSLEVEQKRWIL